MNTLLLVFGLVVGSGLVLSLVRVAQRRKDAERRSTEKSAYLERRRAEASERAVATAVQLASRYFPFLGTDLGNNSRDADPKTRLRRSLEGLEGVNLGQASIGFPAVLPLSERRKHLVVLGKSGFGKTTIALRLLREDLMEGRGVCVLGSEAELFRDWLLPLVPPGRARDVVLFCPSDPGCTLSWNVLALDVGDDRALAAGELFSIFKRSVGETSIGARSDAILASAFSVLMGRPGATLWSVARLLEDEQYRASVIAETDDPYLRDFWTKTFPSYPPNAGLPIANRLNQFLRMPQVRGALCHPISSFSIREALATSKILFFDVSGLDPDATRLLGQMLLTKFQIELMRREKVSEDKRAPVFVYVDEFHIFAAEAEGTWRELLARGRRYGLGLHLFTQHPHQLPRDLQHEIFGNVSSLIALNLAAGDAAAVRRELLVPSDDGARKPIAAEALVSLPVGEGYARLGSGACALRVKFSPPIARPDPMAGRKVKEISWKTYAAPPMPADLVKPSGAGAQAGLAAIGPASPTPAETPGRGGPQHKLLQHLVRQWGEARGFRATLEEAILGGAGRVDVALVRGDVRIAVEVAITSTPQQVAASVSKSLAAGFGSVVVLSRNEASLRGADAQIVQDVGVGDRRKVHLLTPDKFQPFLDSLPGPEISAVNEAGYRLTVVHEAGAEATQKSRRRRLARLVGTALLRRRWSS
jgi:hypothetical protein